MTSQGREAVRELEMSVVGACIERPKHIAFMLERLPLEHFSGGVYHLAVALGDMATDDKPIDPMTLLEHLVATGKLAMAGGATFLHDCMVLGQLVTDVQYSIDTLARLYLRRETFAASLRMTQAAETMEASEWVTYAETTVGHIASIEAGVAPAVITNLGDVLTSDFSEIDWCIPNLLATGTATMLVAEEGVGKSTVLRQLAMAAMCGLSPFEPHLHGNRYRPKRVMLVDCEVSRNRLFSQLNRMWGYARKYTPLADTSLMAVESHQRGLNLSAAQDQAWLHRLVQAHRPDLLVIGPVYRFTDEDINTEEGVRSWQRGFEPMLANGVTVVTEHHAPNAPSGVIRALRPIGSSVLRRWFSQGIALRTKVCDRHGNPFCNTCQRKAVVEAWRGSRDEDARWPRFLQGEQGEVWWVRDEYQEIR